MKNLLITFGLGMALLVMTFTACKKDDDDDDPQVKVDEEVVVVANRNNASISFINAGTNAVINQIELPGSEPMYVVYVAAKDRVYVGDRAQNRVHIINPQTKVIEGGISVGDGVFHMWADAQGKQLWVVNDVDNSISIIDLGNNNVIQTINLGIQPHDVFLNKSGTKAYVSVFSGSLLLPDSVYHYSTNTFDKLGAQAVGKDPHLFHIENNNRLFVACQSGDLYTLNGENLNEISVLPLTGAHGIFASPDQNYMYLSNITGSDLYTVNATTGAMHGSSVNAILGSPHNIVVNMAGDKMFVTHSGATSNKVSAYTISNGNIFSAGAEITTGINPFGIAYYRRTVQ